MQNVLLVGENKIVGALALRLVKARFRVFAIGPDVATLTKPLQHCRHFTALTVNFGEDGRLAYWIAQLQLMEGPLDHVVLSLPEDELALFVPVIVREVEQYRHSSWDLYYVRRENGSNFAELAWGSWCRYHVVSLNAVEDPPSAEALAHKVYCAMAALVREPAMPSPE